MIFIIETWKNCKCELLYTDNNSMLLEKETGDVYADMGDQIDDYDTSDFPKGHYLYK